MRKTPVSPSEQLTPPALLDTDTFSLLAAIPVRTVPVPLLNRIAGSRPGSVFLSQITAEETLRGALALIKVEEARGRAHIGYQLLSDLLREIARFPFLPYDEAAEQLYRSYPAAIRRIGSADCKIAAVAQAHGATVITRNIRHFSEIHGVVWEDWTKSIR